MTQFDGSAHSAEESAVLVGGDDGVRTLTLNRPGAFNSFNAELKAALLSAVRAAAEDESVRALVITGSGKAFCAGQDLKEHLARVAAGDPAVAQTVSDFYNPLITAVTGMRKPVLAAVNGVAAGAGVALALACDLRIAAASASFTMAFGQVALSADSGASYTLPRFVGAGRAARMMLLGERVPADEALRIGLVEEVVPDDAFAYRVTEVARRLADGPTGAFGWIKASLAYGATHDLADSLDFENGAQVACFASLDHREALDAFVSKRPPRFGPIR
jgi:2-(1,2-epoxy-1,2-dihydrophenyl)acetyl-CoA isomerase